MQVLRVIFTIYIIILIAVPVTYTGRYMLASQRFQKERIEAEARGEKIYGDCTGVSWLIIPVMILLSAIGIVVSGLMMHLGGKSNGLKITSIIFSILMAVFPVLPYLFLLLIMAAPYFSMQITHSLFGW